MRNAKIFFTSEEQFSQFRKMMKFHLPSVRYKLTKLPGRPVVEGLSAQKFLITELEGSFAYVKNLKKWAAEQNIIWSTVVREKKRMGLQVKRMRFGIAWLLSKD